MRILTTCSVARDLSIAAALSWLTIVSDGILQNDDIVFLGSIAPAAYFLARGLKLDGASHSVTGSGFLISVAGAEMNDKNATLVAHR